MQSPTIRENGDCAFVVDFRITCPACPLLRSSRTTEAFPSFEAAGDKKAHHMVPCWCLSPPTGLMRSLNPHRLPYRPAIGICMHIAISEGVRALAGDSRSHVGRVADWTLTRSNVLIRLDTSMHTLEGQSWVSGSR